MALPALAQVATVTGSAPNFIGREVALVVHDDPISMTERVLDRTVVDDRGGFVLKGRTESVQYGFIRTGRECGDLFLENGKSVTVRFAPPGRPKGPEGFSDRYFFRLDFIEGDGAPLNREMARFNERLDAFLPGIYQLLKSGRNPKALADSVASFRARTERDFPAKEGFAAEHIFYSIGNVEQTFIRKKEVLYGRYLKDRPFLPWNPEYMRFIEQFHEGTFNRVALVEKRAESMAVMKKSDAHSGMEALLQGTSFLADAMVRQTVLVRGLGEMYGQKGFDDDRTSEVLRRFAKNAGHPVLSRAALNIAERKDRMRPGTPAPDFKLTDSEGNLLRTLDFKGSYLLLEVTETENAYCLQESAVLRDMQKRFPTIRFLTVLVNADERQLGTFKRDFAPARPVAVIDRNDPFLTDHAISSLPTFIIIAPDGRLHRSPAPDPSKGGISELETIEQTVTGKHKVGR